MKRFVKKIISAILISAMALSFIPSGFLAENIDVADNKTVDLVLFMGQSNMAGRGETENAPAVADGRGYEFRSVTDPTKLYPVTEPFGENENNDAINDKSGSGENRRAGGMISALMNSYYDMADVPIVGVQCSQGGKNTKYFKQDIQLNEAVLRYTTAENYLIANGYTIRRKFMVWCQGESDADGLNMTSAETIASSIDGYKLRTTQIFDYIESNTEITNEFIVRTGHYNYMYNVQEGTEPPADKLAIDEKYLLVANAQTDIAETDEQVEIVASFYTDSALKNMRDQYHYHQNVYNEVGTMAGHNIAAVFDNSVEKIIVPRTENYTSTPKPENTKTPSDVKEVDVLFDFNNNTVKAPTFVDIGNNSITCEYAEKSNTDKNIKVMSSKAGTSSIAASYMDLTEYTHGAREVSVSFDMHLPYLSKSCVALVDKSIRKDNYGGSTENKYKTVGDIFTIIGEKEGRLNINEKSNVSTSIGSKIAYDTTDASGNPIKEMKWVHYDISLDLLNKTMTYTVSEAGGTEEYISQTTKKFVDIDCTSFTGIETYSWLKGEQLSMDNLHIEATLPSEPIPEAKIVGADTVSKSKNTVVTSKYSIKKNYESNTDVFKWSASGVDGVTIDTETGILSAENVVGNGIVNVKATVVSSDKLEIGTELAFSVKIIDLAVRKNFEITSSDTSIDISALETYGTDTLRIYKKTEAMKR